MERLSMFASRCALVVLWFCSMPLLVTAANWQTLRPGLEYQRIARPQSGPQSYIHAFRVDPMQYRFGVQLANSRQQRSASVRQLAEAADSLLAINGGFFSPQFDPLGLRIHRGQVIGTLKNTSWWGVFLMRGSSASIVAQKDFVAHPDIDMAVQAGPRLIINSKIPSLKGGVAERSALGVTDTGKVVMVITQSTPMTTTALAKLMHRTESAGGFACTNALNLDGGRSAQMFTRVGKFQLNIPNMSFITDAVVVHPR